MVGLGANAVDFVYRLPAVPQATGNFSKMRISRETISCGGQMTTALVACARFGLRAKYIGATGTDDNGRRIRRELAHHSVDCTDAIIKDARNQYAVIMVDEVTGERIVLWDRDEKLHLRAARDPRARHRVGAAAARGRRRPGSGDRRRRDRQERRARGDQ